jgi:3'-phosphoadenosine 5'-phosphosulfate sulfotransferase (PAPS reductase)/FAD synthetase
MNFPLIRIPAEIKIVILKKPKVMNEEISKKVSDQSSRISDLKKEDPILGYDFYVVAFSGGKDSTACFLHLLDLGIDKSKIELWHHLVDGKEGSTLMDWPVTEDYCRKFAKAFEVPILFSWKEGGFEREMLRNNQPTARNHWEFPEDNLIECGLSGGRGPLGTRKKFPQVSADLSVRWCSSYLKIDVCTSAINNQERFNNKKTLVISGERAEESSARAGYNVFEIDRSDNRGGAKRRHVDHWRPVHKWPEAEIWNIMKRYRVNPHPAYRLGWGRLSCMKCIFGSDNQWTTISKIDFKGLQVLIDYEKLFGVTIHRKLSIAERVKKGKEYDPGLRRNGILEAGLSKTYTLPIFTSAWVLPAGAFGESAGPQ